MNHREIRSGGWLPTMDLNHDKQIQSLLCYRYTIGQSRAFKVGVPDRESRTEGRTEDRGITQRRQDAKKEGTPEADGKITRRRGRAAKTHRQSGPGNPAVFAALREETSYAG